MNGWSFLKCTFYAAAREYAAKREQILRRIDSVLTSGFDLQGTEVQAFEELLSLFSERKHAIALGSCSDALFFALVSLGIGPSDEALVPNFSFVASASAILRTGAKPVLSMWTKPTIWS